ncbi:sorting nexin-33-like isoform X2 [Acanthaster planci]|uniref:Sorting nexin n=1 Tax=Acanthaster planci TaxID=133434 RepID=A0A8B7Z3V5_ACAPL|nr:sorting nexin-33-like isoform X2 [Acanthaster planci]
MAKQVRVLYDFDGEVENGELVIRENQILTIIRQDVGDGWWEAEMPNKQRGLIPEAYVEVMVDTWNAPEDAPPPPPPPPAASSMSQQDVRDLPAPPTFESAVSSSGIQHQDSVGNEDDWDDDDDWDDNQSAPDYTEGDPNAYYNEQGLPQDPAVNGSGSYGLSPPNRQYKQRNSDMSAKTTGTVKKNFASRFSMFAKSGGEAYLLGAGAKKGFSPNVEIRIVETNDGPVWEDPGRLPAIEIKNPKKETKMKGIKSFIAYQITPSDTGIQVSRRYKHFDWLYERLVEKFTFVCIPPLPDKQVTGRYEEAFIEKRMEQLQRWMNRMGSHPVIGQADVFRHFLSCTDDKKWKQGKRKAEKDEHVGAAFLQVIQAPEKPIEIAVVEKQHDNFSRFQKSMDQNVTIAVQTSHEFSKKHTGPFKREFQKVGQSFTLLAQSFELDTRPRSVDDDRPPQVSTKLTEAMKHTGQTYDAIGQLFFEQPKYDGYVLEDFLREYSGLLSTFPDMISFHKHTISTVKECQKQREEQKIDYEEAEAVKNRADVVSYAMMSEINHFHSERVQDFKEVMQNYLTEQIRFYQNITSKLQETLQKYQEI